MEDDVVVWRKYTGVCVEGGRNCGRLAVGSCVLSDVNDGLY